MNSFNISKDLLAAVTKAASGEAVEDVSKSRLGKHSWYASLNEQVKKLDKVDKKEVKKEENKEEHLDVKKVKEAVKEDFRKGRDELGLHHVITTFRKPRW